MGALLYTEDELIPTRVARQDGGASQLLDHLIEAQSAGERQRLVRCMLHAIGFEWLDYGRFTWEQGEPVATRFLSSYAHPRWTRLYFGQRYHEIDFRLRASRRSSLPVVWDIDDVAAAMAGPEAAPTHRRFAEDLRECGLCSGVVLSLASAMDSNERTVIGLASSRPHRRWIDDTVLAQTLMLAFCIHQFLSVHMRPASAAGPGGADSPTRQEILWCMSQGQSTKEIAYRLRLSTHTVKYHMRELRRHFAVSNRLQLLNAAKGGHATLQPRP